MNQKKGKKNGNSYNFCKRKYSEKVVSKEYEFNEYRQWLNINGNEDKAIENKREKQTTIFSNYFVHEWKMTEIKRDYIPSRNEIHSCQNITINITHISNWKEKRNKILNAHRYRMAYGRK